MKPLNTFYDTLQVSRSANESVLRAAYKTLCQKYHPDKNPDDVDGATQDMLLLNKAYEVLSDPGKRLEYDLWITKRERDMRIQQEKEDQAAQAKKFMFPPIEMPPAAPEAPPSASATPVKAPPTPAPKPPPSAQVPTSARSQQDFAPTTVQDPAGQSEFADTQPQSGDGAAAPVKPISAPVSMHTSAMREPVQQSPLAQGVDWLRERPIWLISVVLAAVLVLAFTPWLWHASLGKAKPITPITPDLQPTYVEPAAVPAPAPALAPTPAPAPEPGALPLADNPARTSKATRAAAARRASAMPKKAPEPEAPVQHSQPAPASVPLDSGGHTGFAPKCRWVTPTRWSCD